MNEPHPQPIQNLPDQDRRFKGSGWRTALLTAAGLLILAAILALYSDHFRSLEGWASFLAALLLAGGLLLGGWKIIGRDRKLLSEEGQAGLPRWLAWLMVAAFALRLGLGCFWFSALPAWGHDSAAERTGYVFGDASQRDKAAWKLAESTRPLWTAFENKKTVDQYGGMLFLSAFYYRYLGGADHQPLQMVVITAAFSALAILFTWALARLAWGAPVAWLAAWIMAFYPETVLLGSSQMREAFTVSLTAAAFYGLLRYQKEHTWVSLAWMAVPLGIYLPFSPPFAALLLALLGLTALITGAGSRGQRDLLHKRWFWLALALLVILVLAGLYLTLRQFAPDKIDNPIGMLSWWFRKSTQLQLYISEHTSGRIQIVFDTTPEWLHLPLLLLYGVFQPFLPAALIAESLAPVWQAIAIWRSFGWTLMLAFLLYAPLLAFRPRSRDRLAKALLLVVWIVIILTSLRGGADQWDNPRYRSAFAALQAALAAWVWYEHRKLGDPWLRRTLLISASLLAWFIPWYLRRYAPMTWPVTDLFKTIGLGILTGILLWIWDWLWVKKTGQENDSGDVPQ
jgi:4-amino-4-deoxy-L-arabinose transferase-like glycosyltransferase